MTAGRGRALLLCAAALACLLPHSSTASDLDGWRAAGLKRWEELRKTDHLELMPTERPVDKRRRQIVHDVCAPVKDEEERWMCRRRGARMAQRMHSYTSITEAMSDRYATGYSPRDAHGARFFIKEGKMDGYQIIGQRNHHLLGNMGPWLMVITGKVVETLRAGAAFANQTFDFVVVFNDEADCREANSDSLFASRGQQSEFPVVKYSDSVKGCPNIVPLPFIEALQADTFTPHPPQPVTRAEWDEKRKSMIFRGGWYNDHRLFTGVLGGGGLVPGLDAAVLGNPGPDDHGANRCRQIVKQAIANGDLPATFPIGEPTTVCNRHMRAGTKNSAFQPPVSWASQSQYRYNLAVDGYGALLREYQALASHSVLFMLRIEMEQYYKPDLIPFVHFIPITNQWRDMRANLTESYEWLEKNPDIAIDIIGSANHWASKHKTVKADLREWKLFYAFMADIWVPEERHEGQQRNYPISARANTVNRPLTCESQPFNVPLGNRQAATSRRLACDSADTILDEGAGTVAALAAAVPAPPASPGDAVKHIDGWRAAWRGLWEALLKTDHLELMPTERPVDKRRKALVQRVCAPVKDEEERWMCQRRGARMAERFGAGAGGREVLTAAMADAAVAELAKTESGGVRVFVVKGVMAGYQVVGRTLMDPADQRAMRFGRWVLAAVGKVVEALRGGASSEEQTFDVVIAFGSGGSCMPTDMALPVVKHSSSTGSCPQAVPLPFTEFLAAQRTGTGAPKKRKWTKLEKKAVFRGTYDNAARLQAAVLSAAGAVPGLDAALVESEATESERCVAHVRAGLQKAEEGGGYTPAELAKVFEDVEKACHPSLDARTAFASDVAHADMLRSFRYVLRVDGDDAAAHVEANVLASSSVLLSADVSSSEYYKPDLIPYVHYVPVTGHLPDMRRNLTDNLQWLDADEETAHDIVRSANHWASKHKSVTADLREWRLYFALMADAWQQAAAPTRGIAVLSQGVAACGSLLSVARIVGAEAEAAEQLACNRGAGLTGEMPEAAAARVADATAAGAATPPSSGGGKPTLAEVRASALRAWEALRKTDHLELMPTERPVDKRRKALVQRVCGAVKDEEERWMCQRRGARMAERMHSYTKLTPAMADKYATHYSSRDATGVRVIIREGKLHGYQLVGRVTHHTRSNMGPWVVVLMGRVVESMRAGLADWDTKKYTFDFVVVFNDEADCREANSDSLFASRGKQSEFPVVKYSYSVKGCPNIVPLPFIEALQADAFKSNGDTRTPFAETRPAMVFRGGFYNEHRIHAGLLSASGAVPGLNAEVIHTPPDASMYQRCARHVQAGRGTFTPNELGLAVGAPSEPQRACRAADAAYNRGKSAFGNPLEWAEMKKYRYNLAIDGYGALLREYQALTGGQVLLMLRIEMEQYYKPDLMPFVHFVPITNEFVDIQSNLTDTYVWLEANHDIAIDIIAKANHWASKHKTVKADLREWKLFYAFMADAWEEDTKVPRAIPAGLGDPWNAVQQPLVCPSRGELDWRGLIPSMVRSSIRASATEFACRRPETVEIREEIAGPAAAVPEAKDSDSGVPDHKATPAQPCERVGGGVPWRSSSSGGHAWVYFSPAIAALGVGLAKLMPNRQNMMLVSLIGLSALASLASQIAR